MYLFIIFIVGLGSYIFSLELYNYLIKNFDTCVKILLISFINILNFLFIYISTVFNLTERFNNLMHPLFIFENGEVTNTAPEFYLYGENEKLPESDNPVAASSVKDASQRKIGEGINFSNNTSNSSSPADNSNSTSNNNDTEWAPGLGNPILRTPTQDLTEEERAIAKAYQESIKEWIADLDRQRNEQNAKFSQFEEDLYNGKVIEPKKQEWLEKVNSSALMKGKEPFKANDFDFSTDRELNRYSWFNTAIDYYNREEQEKFVTKTPSDPEQNSTKTKNKEINNQDKE